MTISTLLHDKRTTLSITLSIQLNFIHAMKRKVQLLSKLHKLLLQDVVLRYASLWHGIPVNLYAEASMSLKTQQANQSLNLKHITFILSYQSITKYILLFNYNNLHGTYS